jgi:AcrR family transcriptional regulator
MPRKAAPGTRERVLETAATLFYEHGIRAVGMQQIVNEVGCGKMLLYREFPSKADLVAGYLEKARDSWERRAGKAAAQAPDDDPETQLNALIDAVVEQVREPSYRGCPFRNYLAEFSDHSDRAGRIAVDYLQDVRAQVTALVNRMDLAEPDVATERIWLTIEGLYASSARPGGERAAEVAVSLVRDIIRR